MVPIDQDPRIERSRRVILEAALAELGEVGYGALTIESVAARAGVGKSTIYRHWSGKLNLVEDAFRTLKLVHALRDSGFPSMGWRQALTEAPFTGLSWSTDEETETLRIALAAEERLLSSSPAGVPSRTLNS